MTDEPQRPAEAGEQPPDTAEEASQAKDAEDAEASVPDTDPEAPPEDDEEEGESAGRPSRSGSYVEGLAARRNGSAIACVGCLSALVLGMLASILLFAVSTKNGSLPEPLRQGEIATCAHQMEELTAALQRFRNKHDSYPPHLQDLWPDFLTDESILWCPADEARKGPTSYDYLRPAPDAPSTDIVLKCRFHATRVSQLTLAATLGGEILHLRPDEKSPFQRAGDKKN